MDTIFFNGCIRTLDNSEKVAEAVGIENGRIVFVGTDKEAEAFSCKKRIDLKGRLMLPGFVDTHMHMLHYAFVERSVKLFDCTSVEEMLAAAKKRLEESKGQKLAWLYCRGWNEEHFDKPRYPHKDEPAVSMRRRKSAKSSGRSVRAVSMAKRICSFCESF